MARTHSLPRRDRGLILTSSQHIAEAQISFPSIYNSTQFWRIHKNCFSTAFNFSPTLFQSPSISTLTKQPQVFFCLQLGASEIPKHKATQKSPYPALTRVKPHCSTPLNNKVEIWKETIQIEAFKVPTASPKGPFRVHKDTLFPTICVCSEQGIFVPPVACYLLPQRFQFSRGKHHP